MNDTLLTALADALGPELERQKAMRYGVTFKHDITGTPSAVQYSHGPMGLLSFPGVDQRIFNTTMGSMSMLSRIPATPSLYTNPTYFTITGVRADSGDEPSDACDDAPEAGLMKGCLTTSVFGKYARQTPLLDLTRLGQRNDRADPLDLSLVNSPIGDSGLFSGPGAGVSTPGDILTNEISRKFWERNVALHRLLMKQLWQGNPANNTGGYKEMTGLDLLINTGYVDAETGTACAAMDSYVRNANYGRIDADTTDVVARVTDMYYQLKSRAMRAGVTPVNWVIAMKPQLFYELTALWPCSYLSFRCATSIETPAMVGNIDARDAIRFRDEMRAGQYLIIDGDRVNVVLDDGIAEDDGNSSGGNFPAGCFSTSIYFIPLSVVGGQAVTFMEYFQYQNPSIQDAMTGAMLLGRIEGPWITFTKQTNGCFKWQSQIEPRLVLRTPWLAGKIQNIVYCPVQHEREVFPEDPYFVNGGKSERTGPSFYSLWQS